LRCRFESFEQDDDGVVATVHDLASGERQRISADYLVACCGGHSAIRPTTRPGARAPHAWLPDGRSTLDLFGRGFVLLRLGDGAPDCAALEMAFARRRVPLTVVAIADARICELYERRFVLVRPDGHVAWRSDALPDDPLAVIDRVRGA
ncbi:MAG: FAD-dependent monooxygenase, partial [Xanthobacteraceae bacterium]